MFGEEDFGQLAVELDAYVILLNTDDTTGLKNEMPTIFSKTETMSYCG